jgi:uncharacterized protein (TIGR00661 family)
MKILYGIQGTGHGHISRGREIVPLLAQKADVDVLISGYNCSMTLDDIRVIHKRGISLTYDSNGSVSYLQTALNLQPVRFLQDVTSLRPHKYDLVISDYEPVTAWAAINSEVPCVGLSHQASFLSENCPRPHRRSMFAEQILRHFAPCNRPIGFHYRRYDSFILPPIIRRGVRKLDTTEENHVTVYLPAFDHQTLVTLFSKCKGTHWNIFSPLCSESYTRNNVTVFPVGNETFLKSLRTGFGVVTSAGFETCAEAMYLGKKLLAVPIRNQYEQACNAAALECLGVHVIWNIGPDFSRSINQWLTCAPVVSLTDIADTAELTEKLIRFAGRRSASRKKVSGMI